MTHLDLCSGIGGFTLAAEWAGFQTIGFAEIEPYCCALLVERWPRVKNYGDLRTADFSGLRERITVLSAGVPCQPSSLAGKRKGKDDDRWLWDFVCGVVTQVRPVWVILENPPGILALGEFGGVLLRLEKEGYEIGIFQVPANAVGAKHRRQRVFIIAHAQYSRLQGGQSDRTQEGLRRRFADTSESTLADADRGRRESERFAEPAEQRPWWDVANGRGQAGSDETEALADPAQRSQWPGKPWGNLPWRLTQPPLCRRTDGIQNRSHRLRALGNAVVPQQAYPFFAAIAQIERAL